MSISTLSLPSHAAYHMAIPSAHGLTNAPLTQILLTHNPHLFSLATTSPFLHSAGLGTLPKSTLSKWLSQDRLYAQSYVAFIGALLARVHLPHAYIRDKSSSLRWKIVKLLTGALENIMREMEFFEDVAERYGLDLEASSSNGSEGAGSGFQAASATRQYEALFRAFGSDSSMSLLEGLVVLWATEQVYLSAWRYARSQGQGRTTYAASTNVNAGYAETGMSASGGLPRALSGLSVNGSEVGSVSVSARTSQSPPPNYNRSGNGNGNANTQPTELSTPANDEKLPSSQNQTQSQSQHQSRTFSSPPQSPPPQSQSQPQTQQTQDPYTADLDTGALRREFIPNWTSTAFETFVQDIADVTDELAEREEAWRRIDVFKAVWEHILEVERRFWPDIGVAF